MQPDGKASNPAARSNHDDSKQASPPKSGSEPKDSTLPPTDEVPNSQSSPSSNDQLSSKDRDAQNSTKSSETDSPSESQESSPTKMASEPSQSDQTESSSKPTSSPTMKRSDESQTKGANSPAPSLPVEETKTGETKTGETKTDETKSDQSQLKISSRDVPANDPESSEDDMDPSDQSSSENKDTSDRENQSPGSPSNSQSPNSKSSSTSASKPKSTQPSDSDTTKRDPSDPKSDQEQTKTDPKTSKSGDPATMLPQSDPQSDPQSKKSQPSSPKPDDEMSRRGLDVPRPSSSQSMRLEVTEYVGSFEGETRKKSEVAIAGTIANTHKSLELARAELTSVLDVSGGLGEIGDTQWNETFQAQTDQAEQHLGEAVSGVKGLLKRTRDTPYAFIGVQLAEIAHTHIQPAKDDVQATSTAQPKTRTALLMAARQQTIRAIDRLSELYRRFEKKKREVERDEKARKVKKMYLIYLEDSLAELNKAIEAARGGTKKLDRKMSEQEYEEEYLKRLKEVFEMRNELKMELVRILAEDPQLMRRYFQNFGKRGSSLRSQLNELSDLQNDLYRQVSAVEIARSETELNSLMIEHFAIVSGESQKLVRRAFEIEETFETWLPFQTGESDGSRDHTPSVLGNAIRWRRDFRSA